MTYCIACTGSGFESTDPEDSSTCLRCGGSGVEPGTETEEERRDRMAEGQQ